MAHISLYPTFETVEGDCQVDLKNGYKAYYYQGREKDNVDLSKTDSEHIEVKDSKSWSPDSQDLYLERTITIQDPSSFYGIKEEEFGLACESAEIGIGLIWTSPSSNRRGILPIETLNKTEEPQDVTFTYKIEKGTLRGNVGLDLVFYIKKAGTAVGEEYKFANTEGALLGTLDSTQLTIESKEPVFPIYKVQRTDAPLWEAECVWNEDPGVDQFEDSVSIFINEKHRHFKYIDVNNKNFSAPMLIEVMSGALSVIIETLRVYDDTFSFIDDSNEGSIGQQIGYFRDKLGWNLESPKSASNSIRRYFEQHLHMIAK